MGHILGLTASHSTASYCKDEIFQAVAGGVYRGAGAGRPTAYTAEPGFFMPRGHGQNKDGIAEHGVKVARGNSVVPALTGLDGRNRRVFEPFRVLL